MRGLALSLRCRTRPLITGCTGVTAFLLSSLFGCGAAPAGYPDRPNVTTAQTGWCQSLAKLQGAGDSWEHMADCKAAYPTASAAFLHGITRCYSERIESLGNQAPDPGQLIQDCTDEVVVRMPADDAAARELVDARCRRAERCEKSPVDECKAAFAKLESSQRALFTTRFNGAAQHEIAQCLSSSSCSDESEETAVEDCYKPSTERLLWFP